MNWQWTPITLGPRLKERGVKGNLNMVYRVVLEDIVLIGASHLPASLLFPATALAVLYLVISRARGYISQHLTCDT